MYKHILIPTDGSPLSEAAIRQGVALAKAVRAKVTVLTVGLPFHTFALDPVMMADTPAQYEKDSQALAEKALGVAKAEAAVAGVACETLYQIHDHPYQVIVDTARTKGCDLIFMASHGRKGMGALVLGSETNKVLTHSKIPVLVCR
ncbi:MAG TPA: universal stress protein [Candidatus Nitrosotalea sp.]|jgi:nucleotide-binding universal stress UspA family protein|nr:universal stress protein [Candidatus Nitrosotalea sp.]